MKYEDAIALGGEYEREARAMDWSAEHGHGYEVKCFDGWIGWQFSLKDGRFRRHLRIDWRRLPAWLGDRFREAAMHLRILRDDIRGIHNPYRR